MNTIIIMVINTRQLANDEGTRLRMIYKQNVMVWAAQKLNNWITRIRNKGLNVCDAVTHGGMPC